MSTLTSSSALLLITLYIVAIAGEQLITGESSRGNGLAVLLVLTFDTWALRCSRMALRC